MYRESENSNKRRWKGLCLQYDRYSNVNLLLPDRQIAKRIGINIRQNKLCKH